MPDQVVVGPLQERDLGAAELILRRAFPDGRIGSDPSQATPEHGKRFYDTAVADVARDYEAWVSR